jgi:signal transduction histidine kinase
MHLRRIKVLAVVIPLVGLFGFEVVRHGVIQPAMGLTDRHFDEHLLSGVVLFVGVVAFSFAIFRLLERLHHQLVALSEAAIAVTGDLSVDRVLERVAELARTVADASYASVDVRAGRERTVESGVRPDGGEGLSLPIVVRGARLGELVLEGPRAGRFRASDRGALEIFATQAGIALENARLFEQEQELAATWERVRIGMDLHDGVIQELYGLRLKAEDAAQLPVADGPEATAVLRDIHASLGHVIGDVRTYVYGLRDGDRSVELGPALESLVAEFPTGRTELRLGVRGNARLPAATAANILHVAREAVANSLQHSGASRVTVGVEASDQVVRLTVRDDGSGFDPEATSTGLGIRDMRDRARWCGSELHVESAPGRGTTVSIEAPAGGPKAAVP